MSTKDDIKRAMKEIDDAVALKVENVVNYCQSEIMGKGARGTEDGGAYTANIYISKDAPGNKWNPGQKSAIQTRYKVTDPYAHYYVYSRAPYAKRLEYGWPLSPNSKRTDIRWTKKQPLGFFNLVAQSALKRFY